MIRHPLRTAIILCVLGPALASCTPAPDQAATQAGAPTGVTPGNGHHNSRNSLDWAGSYEGLLPCADCPGVETRLTLKRDGSFERATRKQPDTQAPRVVRGQFSWNAAGSAITLDAQGDAQQYAVGEGRLTLLDRDGQPDASSPNRVLQLLPAEAAVGAAAGAASNATSGAAAPGKADTKQSLEAHRWTLESASDDRGEAIPALATGSGRSLVFTFSGERLGIQGGCNRLSGVFQLSPEGQLRVERIASTNMACDPAAMQADAAVSQLLARPLTVAVAQGATPVLRLASAGGARLVLSGRLTPEARYGTGTRIFFEVAAQPVECSNPLTGATRCLQVRERNYDAQGLVTASGPWRPLFETIEGFTPEPGVRNVLRVNRYQRNPAPPGESALVYVLDLTVESEIVSR